MTLSNQLQDSTARKQAIDPQGSYAVSAPAGSGKTELLIQRTLSLLATVEQPESILGITFTRKAANEMRERVVSALDEARANGTVNSEHEKATRHLAAAVLQRNDELQWNLLENPSRLRFQTIDGLCRQLANQLCLETGIVIPPAMSEDSTSLYRQAAEKTLDFLDAPGVIGEHLRLLIEHLDGNLENLVELIADLLASRDSWLPIIIPGQIDNDYLQERVEALIEETLFQVSHELALYSSNIDSLLDYALLHKEGANQLHPETPNTVPDADTAELKRWKALRLFLLTSGGTYRKRVTVANGFPTESEHVTKAEAKVRKVEFTDLILALEENEQILNQLNRLAILPDLLTGNDENDSINRALFSLLPIAAASFNTLSQELGETDFTAVAIAAIEALGQPDKPTPLALRLDYRIQHILVDEFQDTSSVQIDLLERLTAGWQPDDGRTLFIVGDGMQSIYGFRKANVSLFIRARREGIGDIVLTPLDLSTNFRSDQQIVSWVNQSFCEFFPSEDNLTQGQVAFNPSESIKEQSDWNVDLSGYASAELEAEAIAEDIERKLLSGENSLAILVRGRRHLQTILPALRTRNIQWQAQDIDPLANRMAVMDVHSLTRALCVPADRTAWLAILRAPWAGLGMSDLLNLCEWRTTHDELGFPPINYPPIWHALSNHTDIALSPGGKSITERLYISFKNAFEQLGITPLRQVIESLWRNLDAPQGLLETRDRQDVEDYLNLLESFETGGSITDWIAFERRLDGLYSQPEHSSEACLQIMTIHKSKGLEFDHVYLPALGKITGLNDDPLLLWWQREYEDGSEGYLLAAKPSQRSKKSASNQHENQSLYAYLKAEEAARQRQETARLLYVACTRARKSLFLSATLGWDENKEQISKPASKSMLAILWDLYSDSFSEDFQPELTDKEEQLKTLNSIRRLSPDRPIIIDRPSDGLLHSETGGDAENPAKAYTTNYSYNYTHNYLARITGNLIHHSLMRIVREKISVPDADVLASFKKDWLQGSSGLGFDVHQKEEIVRKLEQMLNSVWNDKTGHWLLDSSHEQSAAELEIDYLDARGGVQLAVVDRTFIDQNTRWVIDYKSSTPDVDETVEQFLQREKVTYAPQLKHYLTLFDGPVEPVFSDPADSFDDQVGVTVEPVKNKRAMLYFPAICASIEI